MWNGIQIHKRTSTSTPTHTNIWSWLSNDLLLVVHKYCSMFTSVHVFTQINKFSSAYHRTPDGEKPKQSSDKRISWKKKWNDKVHTRVRQRKFYPWKLSALNGEFGCNKRTFWFIHINNFFLYFSKAQENARTPESFRFCLCTKTSIFFYFCHKANP